MATSAWRLTFSYRDGVFTLVERRAVEMLVQVDPPPAPGASFALTWIEVRDAADRALHWRGIDRLLGAHVEVFHPDGRIEHVAGAPPQERVFELVIPAVPTADSLAVFATAPTLGPMLERAAVREVVRFSLRDDAGPPGAAP